ncbi:MAG: M3 family oligoendopeptidase [Bdellovibrionota bacterium]
MNTNEILPMWDNTTEYPSFTSSAWTTDLEQLKKYTAKIESNLKSFAAALAKPQEPLTPSVLEGLQETLFTYSEAQLLIYNLSSYASLEFSLDSKNVEAEKMYSFLYKDMNSQFEIAITPLNLFLSKTSEENYKNFFKAEKIKDFAFHFSRLRLKKDHLLTEKEEAIMSTLNKDGHTSWGNLYSSISSSARVKINHPSYPEPVSIAVAFGNTQGSDEAIRKASWEGIQNTWRENQQSAAAIVNALAGWRHDVNQLRSTETKKLDFLDEPLHSNRIKAETLQAMIDAVADYRPMIQAAAKSMAKYYGKAKLDPWDLVAPAPIKSQTGLTFKESFRQVKDAFTHMDPTMGEFAQMMLDKNWIDASVRPNKRNGAYCGGFAKSRSPRVFLTFAGSSQNTSTLAHELGHGYHNWVMRDMTKISTMYTMSLAETASIFAEQTLFDYQISTAKTKDELLDVYWSIAEGAVSLLLNIPTRFEYENNFYEKRKNGFVTPDELTGLMNEAYTKWYGDSLSQPDPMFWATKLHFSMSRVSFYNFPYTFGYLFSLSLYARKEEWGKDFSAKYTAILRDTGLMTAEDLVQKHLGEDITDKKFWMKALSTVGKKLEEFNKL